MFINLIQKKYLKKLFFSIICVFSMSVENVYGMLEDDDHKEGMSARLEAIDFTHVLEENEGISYFTLSAYSFNIKNSTLNMAIEKDIIAKKINKRYKISLISGKEIYKEDNPRFKSTLIRKTNEKVQHEDPNKIQNIYGVSPLSNDGFLLAIKEEDFSSEFKTTEWNHIRYGFFHTDKEYYLHFNIKEITSNNEKKFN